MFKVGDRVIAKSDKGPIYEVGTIRFKYTDGAFLVFWGRRQEDILWPNELMEIQEANDIMKDLCTK